MSCCFTSQRNELLSYMQSLLDETVTKAEHEKARCAGRCVYVHGSAGLACRRADVACYVVSVVVLCGSLASGACGALDPQALSAATRAGWRGVTRRQTCLDNTAHTHTHTHTHTAQVHVPAFGHAP